MNDIMTKPCAVHYFSNSISFSFSFVASFIVFNVVEFALNWFFTLIAFDKKGITVPMQTRAIFLFLGENELHHRKARVHKKFAF